MIHYIYKITNNINGKIYIGRHSCKCKICKYMGSGNMITMAISKYGKENFTKVTTLIEPFGVKANHISAITATARVSERDNNVLRHSFHVLEDLSELDYLKNYPEHYFGNYLAIELENPICDQLKAKQYIL